MSKAVFARHSPLEDRTATVPVVDQIAQFAELGWLQLSDPTAADEECAPLGTIAAIFLEAGRALAATPLLELTTARDAALAAESEAGAVLAQRIGNGDAIVVPAFPTAGWGSSLTFSDGRLNGVVAAVGYADDAESLLVHAAGSEAVLVAVPRSAVSLEPIPTMGDHPLFAVTFDGVVVNEGDVLARGAQADRARRLAEERADVLRAAQVHGAGLQLLDMTVLYAQQRHQFGGPIGRFQAVQYLCTDIAVATHVTGAHTRSAAAAIDAGLDPQPHLGLMRRQAAEAAHVIVHSAHEVHAGIGFMVESNVHLFTDAAKRWQYDFGSAASNDAAVVEALEGLYTEAGL